MQLPNSAAAYIQLEKLTGYLLSEEHRDDSAYGTKYVIVGAIESPLGRMVTILTVWIIDSGTTAPRFVTARPYKMQN